MNKGMLRRLAKIAANDYDSTSYPKETERLILAGLVARREVTAPYKGGYRPPYSPPPKVSQLVVTEAGHAALHDSRAEVSALQRSGGTDG